LGLLVVDQNAVLLRRPSAAVAVLVRLQHPWKTPMTIDNHLQVSGKSFGVCGGECSCAGEDEDALLVRSRNSSSSPLLSFAEVS
jgi:hypothetical protein